MLTTAFDRIKARYDADAGKDYELCTQPYISAGGFKFDVVDVDFTLNRGFLLALKGQNIEFFGYGIKDNVANFGLPTRAADDHDTNQQIGNKTNTEDVSIEGLSCSGRGLRVLYDFDPDELGSIVTPSIIAMLQGDIVVTDPGSNLLPPEVSSPLLLQNVLYQAVAPKVILTPAWGRKREQHIGVLKELPEGGSSSYLEANGEPNVANYFPIREGWEWLKEGSPYDTLFALNATLVEDVIVPISLPQTYASGAGSPAIDITPLTAVWLELVMKAHTMAFAYPSRN